MPKHISWYMYCTLTGDNSDEATSHQIDERIRLAIETEDPKLVTDLHHLNKGCPGDTFTILFCELEAIVEQLTAADDRRHKIAHMSEFFSVCDLIEKVKARIPEGLPLPSVLTVIHLFVPPNMHTKTAQYCTGKMNLPSNVVNYMHIILMPIVAIHFFDTYERMPLCIEGSVSFSLVMINPRWILESLELSCPQVLERKKSYSYNLNSWSSGP